MTRAQFAKYKAELIAKQQEKLQKTISIAEKAMYKSILDKFINELELVDGRVVSNGKNIESTAQIDRILDAFSKSGYLDIIKQFTGDLLTITSTNAEYFRILGEAKDRIPQAKNKANERLKKQLGINEKGQAKKNGYIDKLIKDKSLAKGIKKAIYKGIAGNVDLKKIQDDIKFVVEGTEEVNGALSRHLNTSLMDAYQSHDRNTGSEIALAIDISAFIYSGGLIGSSRCFCDSNNGKVFTRQEANKWKSKLNTDCGPIWNEEKDGDYDPIERMGGYGCRHSVDWISNAEAVRRRPELKHNL